MEVKDLLEFTHFNILLENIEEEFNKQNYIISADLSNKLLKKLAPYTNMNSEKGDALMYKLLSDIEIIKSSKIANNAVVLTEIIAMV